MVGFTCPRCGRTSYHPTDAAEGYCAACDDWTAGERITEDARRRIRRTGFTPTAPQLDARAGFDLSRAIRVLRGQR